MLMPSSDWYIDSYGLIMDMEGSIMNQFHLLNKNCQNMQFFASKMNPLLIVLTIMILKESSERHNRKWNCHLATSAYLLSLRIFSFVWIFLRKILSADPLYTPPDLIQEIIPCTSFGNHCCSCFEISETRPFSHIKEYVFEWLYWKSES